MNKLKLTNPKYWVFFFSLLLIVAFKTTDNKEEYRLALVIGNNDYEHATSLDNPVNDAKEMKKVLTNVGFEVVELYNANRQEIIDKFRETRKMMKGKNSNFLLFYAGHGLQSDEDNWIVPIDAHPQTAEDVKISCISLSFIMKGLELAETNLNIIILDACRINPFKYTGRSVTGGLISPNETPMGTFLAFSTAPRTIALDGVGKNSPYTEALTKAIQIPNIPIEKTFKIVRNSLMETTKQISWENSSLIGDFYFNQTEETVADSDGDGINDSVDECPNQAGSLETHGCPNVVQLDKKLIAPSGMVYIKSGTFDMGDIWNEGDKDERPVKKMTIAPFFLDKYEVSNHQFCEFLNEKGNQKKEDEYWVDLNSKYCGITQNKDGKFEPKTGLADHPVVEVNWYGAKAYCDWKTENNKGKYRLPTEAEWEFAAREGGKKIRFGNGQNMAQSDDMNYNASMKEPGKKYSKTGKFRNEIMAVNSFAPNEFGLYNMAGNVWEWCSDIYEKDFSKAQHSTRDFIIISDKKRVIKGGAWDGPASYARATNKFSVPPRVGYLNIGFRCVKEIE